MGTFNDPNQFAFFIFTMLLILVLIYLRNQQKKYIWLFWADAVFLIGVSNQQGFYRAFNIDSTLGGMLDLEKL
mgnify:CR=1 FL=1